MWFSSAILISILHKSKGSDPFQYGQKNPPIASFISLFSAKMMGLKAYDYINPVKTSAWDVKRCCFSCYIWQSAKTSE